LNPGRYHFTLIPRPGRPEDGTKSYSGEGDAVIEKGQLSTVRIALVEHPAVPVSVAITASGAWHMKYKHVELEDVTLGKQNLITSGRIDAAGVLTFNGFAGRTYRLEVELAGIASGFRRMYEIKVTDKPQRLDWVVDPGPVLRIVVIDGRTGEPYKNENQYFGVMPDNHKGMGFDFHEGTLILSKSSGMLAGAKQVRLSLPEHSPDPERYIAENEAFDLDDSREQVVRVRIDYQKFGGMDIAFSGVEERVHGEITCQSGSGDRIRPLGIGPSGKLPVGNYNVTAWKDGYKVARQAVSVTDSKTTKVIFEMSKGQSLTVRVLDQDGKPCVGAFVMVCYPKHRRWESTPGKCDAQGETIVAVDWDESPFLHVADQSRGIRLVQLQKREADKPVKVVLQKPCKVAGEISGLPKEDDASRKPRVVWVQKEGPYTEVWESPIKDGKFTATLQPGTYLPFLGEMNKFEVFPLPEVMITSGLDSEVVITSEKEVLTVVKFQLTKEIRSKKIEGNAFFAGME
jgi:hypothetical protein